MLYLRRIKKRPDEVVAPPSLPIERNVFLIGRLGGATTSSGLFFIRLKYNINYSCMQEFFYYCQESLFIGLLVDT